jgi:hypothetical protein
MFRGPSLFAGAAAVIALALPTSDLSAQNPASGQPTCAPMSNRMAVSGRASPYDSTFADIGAGRVKVCYGRPSVLGRTLVGGTAHPFGQPWRMGANEPTILHTNVALLIGDIVLQPGSYSLYAIPTATEWEIVVNRSIDRWGIPISDAVRAQDVGSVRVPTGSPPTPVEVFTIRFGPPAQGRTPLIVEWENYRVSIPFAPAPS